MKYIAKKSLWLSSLMLLSCCRAQPVQFEEERGVREQRQLKSSAAAAAEADVKMLAASAGNMTPASSPMQLAGLNGIQGLSGLQGLQGIGGLSGLPINQQQLLSRYTGGYPGLIFGGASAPGAPLALGGFPGMQNNYAGGYTDPNLSLAYGLAGLGNYPGQGQMGGFMQNALYPHQQQLGAAFGSQPGVDLSALNNMLGMQGLGGAAAGLYPQAGGAPGMAGGFGFGADEATSNLLKRMNIHGY